MGGACSRNAAQSSNRSSRVARELALSFFVSPDISSLFHVFPRLPRADFSLFFFFARLLSMILLALLALFN